MTTTKTINLDLAACDGNAFALMGAFSKQAKREGWPKAEIEAVLSKAMAGDYDHLLRTLIPLCEPRDEEPHP